MMILRNRCEEIAKELLAKQDLTGRHSLSEELRTIAKRMSLLDQQSRGESLISTSVANSAMPSEITASAASKYPQRS
jgi:hypothetical protein